MLCCFQEEGGKGGIVAESGSKKRDPEMERMERAETRIDGRCDIIPTAPETGQPELLPLICADTLGSRRLGAGL